MSKSGDLTEVLQLDRLIHEPARLLILSILAGAESAEFGFVEQLSGLSKGNLSSHLGKLESAGQVEILKTFRGKRPLTTLRLTPGGRQSLAEYRKQLASVVAGIPQNPYKES
ncbi:MAG: transcriptional regulator [Pseudomonadota bacterium]|nr:transcriptional regulator [Pseudomonadota bacterium]